MIYVAVHSCRRVPVYIWLLQTDLITTYVLCQEIFCRQPPVSGVTEHCLASGPLYNFAWHALLYSAYFLTLLFVAAVLGLLVSDNMCAPCAHFDNSGLACLQATRLCAKPVRQVCRPVKPCGQVQGSKPGNGWCHALCKTCFLSCFLIRHA